MHIKCSPPHETHRNSLPLTHKWPFCPPPTAAFNVFFPLILKLSFHSSVINKNSMICCPNYPSRYHMNKFVFQVEEETRDKLYRDTLNNHIKSLIILLNPVSLMQFDLLNLENSVQYLCKVILVLSNDLH